MSETLFAELKRYVRFNADDEAALREFAQLASPHLARVVERFYVRLQEHREARRVLQSPEQVERLRGTLLAWLQLLLVGPWDEAYFERRARIGRRHVKIGLPQHYMFGAMNVVRGELLEISREVLQPPESTSVAVALNKILDLELSIMLETYREAFVERVQHAERVQRALLQQQLALSEARYAEIVELGEALTVSFDAQGRIRFINRRAAEVCRVDREQALGRNWLELFCAEEERAEVVARWHRALDGKRVSAFEARVVSTATPRRVRWHFTSFPGHDALLCGIGLDVTDEYELNLRTRRAERLAALGTMAAGLAHEIRNPLNAANIQLTLAQRKLARGQTEDPQKASKAMDLAGAELRRLASLVEDFLQFARPQPLRLSFMNLRTTVELTLDLLGPEAEPLGVGLSLNPGEAVWLEYDDEKIRQVLFNLVRNALEASERGNRIVLDLRAGDRSAVLDVEDEGRGLATDQPIFEPFFTTKETGTGLGLAIVHRIIEDHGGSITVHSRPGCTVFSVSLPRVGATAPDSAPGVSGTTSA